jgi:heme/copper-type cytochrome/quinol oxidase subunit 2
LEKSSAFSSSEKSRISFSSQDNKDDFPTSQESGLSKGLLIVLIIVSILAVLFFLSFLYFFFQLRKRLSDQNLDSDSHTHNYRLSYLLDQVIISLIN